MVHGLVAECADRPAGREVAVIRTPKLSAEDREKQRDAAYERGWVDSLTAHWNTGAVSFEYVYYYGPE